MTPARHAKQDGQEPTPTPRFTAHASNVLVRARRYARQEARATHSGLSGAIATHHLLSGLLQEQECTASIALRACGVTWESARPVFDTLTVSGSGICVGGYVVTPRVQRLFESAAHEAAQRGRKLIGTEHLLLALIGGASDGGIGTAFLHRLGVQPAAIRATVEQHLAR